jgi:hypothetical protein
MVAARSKLDQWHAEGHAPGAVAALCGHRGREDRQGPPTVLDAHGLLWLLRDHGPAPHVLPHPRPGGGVWHDPKPLLVE